MDDDSIIEDIGQLVEEEKQLRARHTVAGGLGDEDRERLRAVEERLDQCWDLLRQRRAAEEFDQDPDRAAVRPVSEVEGYRQ
jgi:Protein of unknown function (DUF2630)